jgi:hypothetical protein
MPVRCGSADKTVFLSTFLVHFSANALSGVQARTPSTAASFVSIIRQICRVLVYVYMESESTRFSHLWGTPTKPASLDDLSNLVQTQPTFFGTVAAGAHSSPSCVISNTQTVMSLHLQVCKACTGVRRKHHVISITPDIPRRFRVCTFARAVLLCS